MPRPRTWILGLATLAVAAGGVTAAATTGTVLPAASSASAAHSAPAAAKPAPAKAAPAPAPTPITLWVRVPAANVWFKVAWVRHVDRSSLGAHPDLRRWVQRQTYAQRLQLGNNLMTQALKGEQVVLLGTRGRYDKVQVVNQRGSVYPLGIVGWVDKSQLSAAPVAAARTKKLPHRAASVIAAARAYRGTTYIFGGMTHLGIDCSGLTYLAAEAVGVRLPRDAADQSRVGRPVGRHALRPGDLVFFGPGGRSSIHHVGIYVGHGRILHAPHTGSSVRVTPLSQFPDYWGARRIV